MEVIDIQEAIDELRTFSFIEVLNPSDQHKFINVPLTASIFGLSKFKSNPNKAEIIIYTRHLQEFGASQAAQINEGIEPKIRYFFNTLAKKVTSSHEVIEDYQPIIQFICRRFNKAKLFLALLYDEHLGDAKNARKYLDDYLRTEPNEASKAALWDRLARYYQQAGQTLLYFQTLIEKNNYQGCGTYPLFQLAISLSQTIKENKFKKVPKDIRNELIGQLIRMIEKNPSFSSMNASEHSYLAWLYVHMGEPKEAKRLALKGSRMESNKKCQEILTNLQKIKL